MCSFRSCQTRFEFLSQFRKVRNAFECFITQVQTRLPKTKCVWPMKINVICTVSGECADGMVSISANAWFMDVSWLLSSVILGVNKSVDPGTQSTLMGLDSCATIDTVSLRFDSPGLGETRSVGRTMGDGAMVSDVTGVVNATSLRWIRHRAGLLWVDGDDKMRSFMTVLYTQAEVEQEANGMVVFVENY